MDEALALRVLLAKRNKSQRWLASQLGVSRPFVCKLYNGNKRPSLEMIKAICDVFGISVSEFAKGGEE